MNTLERRDTRMPLAVRIIVVLVVLTVAFLSVIAGLPLADLLGLDPSDLQGSGFSPTVKTLTVVFTFAASQFLLIWLVMRFVHREAFRALGFKGPILLPLLLGTLIGMCMQGLEYLLLHLSGSGVSITTQVPVGVSVWTLLGYMALNVLVLLTLNSLKEELVYRAYPISRFDDRPRLMIPVLVLVSLVFAAVHHILLPFAWDDFVSRFTIALLLSFVYYLWRSIWLISGVHNGLNLLVYLTGGNYKMGGLLLLTMAHDPSPAVSITVDILLAALFIALFQLIWMKEKRFAKGAFGITRDRLM